MSLSEIIDSEIERMEKLGYTTKEIIQGINALLRVQNMVTLAVL
jgi:hypothetical protein